MLGLVRYFVWALCAFSLALFAAYALKNMRATRGRIEHRLTFAAAIIFAASFAVSAVASFLLPEGYLVYSSFGAWCLGLLLLTIREVLRWSGIKKVYGGSFSRILRLYLEIKNYMVSSTLILLLVLAVWVFFILKPFGAPPSVVGVAALAALSLAVMNLAIGEKRFNQKLRHGGATPNRRPMSPGKEDLLAVTAFADFINSFLDKTKIIATSPAIGVLADHYESNPMLFEGCHPAYDGRIDIGPIIRNLNRLPEENRNRAICLSFSLLTARLIGVYSAVVSREWAEKTTEDCYRSAEARFRDTPIAPSLLRMIPKGILETEKLALLSKEELEARVKERTAELEESREQLRALKEFHEQIVKKAPAGIVRTDKEGVILFANPKAADIVGTADFLGTSSGNPNPEGAFSVKEALRLVGFDIDSLVSREAPRGEYHTDYTFVARGGKSIQSSTSVVFLADKAGKFDGLLLLIEDITSRKALEEERQRIDKLKTVGTLAGGIAHDFNNLLAGIMGNIGLAKMFVEPMGKAFEVLAEAEKASIRAKDLTQQLLTFSRGGLPVKRIVSAEDLTLEAATFALRGSSVKPVFSLARDLWAIDADEGQINQVILNLARNADQAMPHGGVLNITARNLAISEKTALPLREGKYIEITIEDHGIGIPKENMPRMFEPYFTTKEKGNGLGLATCYSIVKNHGGHIAIESEEGVGTTIHVYLPASERPIPKKEAAVRPARESGKGRILVMDDEEMIRQMVKMMLQLLGYESELTRNGSEAIERYCEAKQAGHPFDAVIMDLTIPGGMGGKEAIGKLLEIDPMVKAIVSSGYAASGLMSGHEESGFRGVITKPYTMEQLRSAIQDVLNS